MRVLQVITDTERRGAQVFATDLHGELTSRDWDVSTVALECGSQPALDVPILGRRRPGLRTLRRLRRRCAEVDVVVAHGSKTLPAVAIATVGLRTPFVYRQISDSAFWANTPSRRVRVRAGLARARLIVALWDGSGQVLQEMFGVPPSKIRVVPNGVVASAWRPSTEDERRAARLEFGLQPEAPVVAFVGALAPEKGPDLAVEAVRPIDGAQLLVVGHGVEEGRIRSYVETHLNGRAVMTGGTSDVWRAYAAADVLVFPSRSGDSMPAVVIEAGLSGVPIVATAVGALAQMIESGNTGVLVAPGDVGAMTTAIRSLLEDREAAREMGLRLRPLFQQRFDLPPVAASWSRVLEEATGARAGTAG